MAMCVAALEANLTCTSIDAASVLQRDLDDALVPIVDELERVAGISPLRQAAERYQAERDAD
jgi:hypothetical protein